MGTRGIIARKLEYGFSGVYHHWDSYPTSLGRMLHGLYNGHFNKEAQQMMHFLIDEHPAGWSNIVDADFSLPAGFAEMNVESDVDAPHCYCHSDRHDAGVRLTSAPSWCEYLYVVNEETAEMDVFEGASRHLATVRLNDVEPDWEAIERQEEE